MSSTFKILKPLLVAQLPEPVGHDVGRYVVSDVHGGVPGTRKRKRAELAVGIDGEGINLYDIPQSKLITSYALPPQASITCAPASLRLNLGKNRSERRTYIATTETESKITLFKEATQGEGHSDPSSATHHLTSSNKPVVFLGVAHERNGSTEDNLIVVKGDGEIQCLSGEDLRLQWTSQASAIARNSSTPEISENKVEHVTITDAHTASTGLLKNRPDVLSIINEDGKTIEADGFNPTIITIITSPVDTKLSAERNLHVFTLPRLSTPFVPGQIHSVQRLLSMPLSWEHTRQPATFGEIQYEMHPASGQLYQLAGRNVTIYDLSAKDLTQLIKSQLAIDNASSFLRLEKTALMTATRETVDIYIPEHHARQTSLKLDSVASNAVSRKRKHDDGESAGIVCKLVSYSQKHKLVHAIIGSELVAFAIDVPALAGTRRRALGLLVDSLGCPVTETTESAPKLRPIDISGLTNYIAGTKSASDNVLKEKLAKLDEFVAAQDINAFEELMAAELGIKREAATDGAVPGWMWPASRVAYPEVDPRLTHHALSRIFSWSSLNEVPKLIIVFFPHNVVQWLLETGNMSKQAIESALRKEARGEDMRDIPAGQVVEALVDVDREMKALLSFLQHNYLDASELAVAIRILMESLGIFGESSSNTTDKPLLLTHGDAETAAVTETEIEKVEEEIQAADAALQLAEYRLGDGASVRDQALSLSLSKLHACPPNAVVVALKSHLSATEIVSLIYLLRFELARGAWTSRYLDSHIDDDISEEERTTQDSTIVLIACLVNSCIDAIGSSGWLSGGVGGDKEWHAEELVSNLKLEISAALEGIEEATYLRGLVQEVVRFGEATAKSQPVQKKRRKNKDIAPTKVEDEDMDSVLPFGLKVESQVSLQKVGAGGEIIQRTMRDIGQQKSRKVGKYSREKIVI